MLYDVNKITKYQHFRCLFIPPHVLEFMAKEGHEAARFSVLQDSQTRAERTTQKVDVPTLVSAIAGAGAPPAKAAAKKKTVAGVALPPPGTAGRAVYDCNHQWGQPPPFVLKRGEGDPVTSDDSVNDAYDAGGAVRDYYKNKLNRNSIDNLGLNQIHNVHFGVNYMNAFWNGSQMFYGDGDGTIFANFTGDADVIGHELTHGVTQYTAGLVYDGQSGALNESFSDVFGSAIEQFMEGKNAGNADWLIGDGIMGPDLYGEALRSMKAPGTAYDNSLMGKDPQPDHMSKYYSGPADNHGVHINSGIPNKVFYLVAIDDNIGTDKAALLWYTTLQKLWPAAVFSDFAKVLVDSARLLVKDGTLPAGATQTVRLALREVGL